MKKTLFASTIVALGLAFAAPASAVTYDFIKFTNNNVENLNGQVTVDVTDNGSGTALFTFFNAVGIASSITDIYFDQGSTGFFSTADANNDGAPDGIVLHDASAGVDFDDNANPSNVPGGNTIGFTADFSGDSDTPGITKNGVNASGEWVSFLGTLSGGNTFSDLIAALSTGTFRIAMHVQAIGAKGGSDGYVSAVPLPAAAWLFGSALLGFIGLSSRRRV